MMGSYGLISGDFVTTGGMDRANHALATFLADRGDEVHLAGFRASEDLLTRANVTFHRARKPLNSYLLASPVLEHVGRSMAKKIASRGGRVVVNGGNCNWSDVNWVHYVHAAWPPTTSGGLARRFKTALSHRRALGRERLQIGRARLVIANSERTRKDLIERVGVKADCIKTIYLGADVDRFRPPSELERATARVAFGWGNDRPVVAFIGAMGDRRKGFDTLYAAWKQLASQASWDARLAVVGAGASIESWKARSRAEGLSGSIEFLGFRSDVPAILAACDILVSPARYEAYGLNVHEALCCGLPALASRDSGVAEQFPESLAELLLPDPNDAADLAARLRMWRDRDAAWREAVAPVAQRLHLRSWNVVAREFMEAVESF
jgi:glycosyltransferase involved in cell wall biosynthesis